ncbi:glycosyl hydrolase family 8 [Paenibacillus assamensis]|uniref:glycosyl hydrolase family 8 n=1 Tax=Paenibacillus assamensis TaxID=311244 RepID=UPI000422F003|nr:glycosyl hydrolase family 8 [Paenibacillus assamensis]
MKPKKPFMLMLCSALLLQTLVFSAISSAQPTTPPSVTDAVDGQHAHEQNIDTFAAAQRAFPQHVTYSNGIIKPSVSQSKLDQEVRRLYNEWKAKYVKAHPYKSGRYFVHYNQNGESTKDPLDAVTVSEAHGYGMIATAYLAGHDADAKKIFDGMYRFYRDHPSTIHPDLMAWQQVDRNGAIITNPKNGGSSATDGDMDIAYALLLAEKQWGNNTGINYGAQAKKIINAIMLKDVNHTYYHLKLGNWVQDSDPKYGPGTRTSDFMLHHLKVFQTVTGDSRWNQVITTTHAARENLYYGYAAKTGLLPDFGTRNGQYYEPVKPIAGKPYLENIVGDGIYYYNAARIPWRIATDVILTGDTRSKFHLTTLNNWIRTEAKNNPANIHGGGFYLDGTKYMNSGTYYDLTFTAPFAVSAMTDNNTANKEWLDKLWTNITAQPTNQASYFGNTIRLLSVIVVSGNWWSPN